MKNLWVLPLVVVIMAITACGDTTSPEPTAVSDSANTADLDATVEARVQATVEAQPVATSTPVPTATHTPAPTSTPAPVATNTPAPTPTVTLTYEEYFELAIEDYTNEEIEDAIANLSKAIELNPDFVDAYYFRGLVYVLEGDYDKSIADFDRVIELDPDNNDSVFAILTGASAYLLRAGAYYEKDDYDAAIADFDKVIEMDPGHPDAYYLRGEAHYFNNDDDKAITDFSKAIELNSDFAAEAYYFRGNIYTFKDDYDKAIADFEEAIELDPEYTDAKLDGSFAYLLRGQGYLEEDDYDGAIADLERAVELDAEYTDARTEAAYAYLRRGVDYAEEGDQDRAIADFDRAVEIAPDDTRVKNARKFIEPTLVSDELLAERIEWSLCKGTLECGFIEVPADYRNPDAGSIRIGVNVRRADYQDERIGYLFVNPGGPGASGLELVQDSDFVFADELIARFDIVGFDPRGVGESEPEFACGALGERQTLLGTIEGYIDTPEEVATGEAAANLCIESMGPVGALLHSEYVARDMDEIRKALGAEQISYLGFSYGSALGVWYATLFPESVRAMVADGADNPVDQADTQQERLEESIEERAPFEEQLRQALMACDNAECPIYNDGDSIGYYYRAAEKLHLVNAGTDNNPYAGYLSVVGSLYDEDDWPTLWQGLFELNENDDPSILIPIAESKILGQPAAANFTAHVKCLDGFVLKPELDRATRLDDSIVFDAVFEEKFPLVEAADSDFPSACPFYDQFAPEPLGVPLDGGGVPILVVGNHDDPATSFGESEEFVDEVLSNGYLLETSHARHVVYPDNECVNGHVHRALIDGEYPDERRVFCERED